MSSLKPVGLLTGKRRRTAVVLDDAFEYEARGDVDKGVRPGLLRLGDATVAPFRGEDAGRGQRGAFEAALVSKTTA